MDLGGAGDEQPQSGERRAELPAGGGLVVGEADPGADLAVLAAGAVVQDAGEDGTPVAGQIDDDVVGAVFGEVAAVVSGAPVGVCAAGAAGPRVASGRRRAVASVWMWAK